LAPDLGHLDGDIGWQIAPPLEASASTPEQRAERDKKGRAR